MTNDSTDYEFLDYVSIQHTTKYGLREEVMIRERYKSPELRAIRRQYRALQASTSQETMGL